MIKKLYLVIDVGGTKIALSFFSKDGKFLGRKKISTNESLGPKDAVNRIHKEAISFLVNKKLSKNSIKKVTVGCPGPFDYKTGTILDLPNLHSWKNFPLKNSLTKIFNVPAHMENDANLAGLGEAVFGAGRGHKRVLFVTYSTGIGGAFINKGNLYHGATGDGFEIGHMTVKKNGKKCGCSKLGCLEAHASGSAMQREAVKIAKKNKNSKLYKIYKNEGNIDVAAILKAVKSNDQAALKLWNEALDYFSIGVANLIQIVNPDIIVIGGGVSNAWNLIKPVLEKNLTVYAWERPAKACKIVRAKLEDTAADWGGFALLRNT